MNRSRSAYSSSMKTTTTNTSPAVANGLIRDDYVLREVQRALLRNDLDRQRFGCIFCRPGRLGAEAQLLADALDDAGDMIDETATSAEFSQRSHLLDDVGLIGRNILRQVADLRRTRNAKAAMKAKAMPTVMITARIFGIDRRRRNETIGASANVKSNAIAKGKKTSRPR
jgi:hypothetical protein